jgi:putative PEP-CTERM system histidine kinase
VVEFSFRDPATVSYGLGMLAFIAFSAHLGLGWRGGLRASILLGTIVISAVWAALNLGYALTDRPAFWTGQAVLDALRVGGWLLFVGLLLGGQRAAAGARIRQAANATAGTLSQGARDWAPPRGGTSWWAAALLVLPAAVWFFPPGPPVRELASAAALSRLPYGLLLGVSVIGLVLTEQIFRRALEQSRWSIKPLCIGLGAGFVFDLYMYADALLFGRLDANVWAARGFAQALVIPFIALATVRNREWTLDIALSRGVVFHSTAFLATGIYLLTVAAAGYYVRYFGGSWGRTFQVGFIFAAVLLLGWLFSSGTLRAKLKVFINKNFFSYRYDYREEWLRFTNLLSTRSSDVSIPQRCIQALANLVESPAGALWLHDDSQVFAQAARWNLPDIQAQEPADQPLPRFLRTKDWVINLQEYREQPSRYPELQLPDWLKTLPTAWLIVPIVAQDELMGFMILATPRAALDVNWEVRDLLKTAARQVGSFLAQIQSSEALLEAKKFDAFNKMATFVVHDLKNLVAQLTLLLKNAERHRQNPRFQDDMLSTVKHVAERMNKLLLQLSTGARGEQNMRPIDLGRVAERVVGAKADQRTDIALEISGDVVALAYEQRLERVIGHLVQNAIDATRDGGAVGVHVFADQGRACVAVIDGGCGMSEEFVREKLFRPFQTTKRSGMGIGAYETAQYVKEIGGRIETDSTPGAGTTIKVILPLHGSNASGGRQDREVA